MNKGPLALRTISETAEALGVQQHVLRFWETKFTFIRPTKRAGGRRFYRPQDVELLQGVRTLLHDRGFTIRGVQKLFKDEGLKAILDPTGAGAVPQAEVSVGEAESIRQPAFERRDSEVPQRAQQAAMSAQMRESFLDIAKALEAAQAALGRHIGKP